MISPCAARVVSILSNRLQILEIESLSFWMEASSWLVAVMELVALEGLVIEAHVLVGELQYVLTDSSAALRSGSGFVGLKVISVLKRSSVLNEGGTSSGSCLLCFL